MYPRLPSQAVFDTQRGVAAIVAIRSMVTMDKWQDRARSVMKERGITHEALMDVLGVTTRGAVGHYMHARREPSLDKMKALAKHLGVNIEWLLEGTGPKWAVSPENALIESLRSAGWKTDRDGIQPITARVGGHDVTYRPDIRAERAGKVLYFDIKDAFTLADPLHRALASQRPELIQLPPESAPNAAFFAEQRLAEMNRLREDRAEYLPEGAITMPSRRTRVPVVGSAQLGDDGHWADLDYPVGHGDGYIDFHTTDPNAYALRCKGDSMSPRIKEGEFVVVEPNSVPHPGDEVMVKAKDGRVMIKELLYVRDGLVHLASVNEAHGRITIPIDQIDAMHLVAGIAKRVRWHPD